MKLIFEYKKETDKNIYIEKIGKEEENKIKQDIKHLYRKELFNFPQLTETTIFRHYYKLVKKSYGVDDGFYPLGSCTMKYNPKSTEGIVNNFKYYHPLTEKKYIPGLLQIIKEFKTMLCRITGLDEFTLQPAAGAHGEYTGLRIIKQYLIKTSRENRNIILVPDSSHGTNPASAARCFFKIILVKSNNNGCVDLDDLKKKIEKYKENLAGMMMTNPNTLGIFEKDCLLISELIHNAGGLMYYDGANFNALIGKYSIKKMGFDVAHLNLHKTFATPHGGGGPGSGPVGVVEKLKPYLPDDFFMKNQDTIGNVISFYGPFNVWLKAYIYLLIIGIKNLHNISETAVLNANYMKEKIKQFLPVPYDEYCMHEFVASAEKLKKQRGISALNICKELINRGYHPPTMYFPLIVKEAIMIEPTETESKETMDKFIETLKSLVNISEEEKDNMLHSSKIDETSAARHPDLCWKKK